MASGFGPLSQLTGTSSAPISLPSAPQFMIPIQPPAPLQFTGVSQPSILPSAPRLVSAPQPSGLPVSQPFVLPSTPQIASTPPVTGSILPPAPILDSSAQGQRLPAAQPVPSVSPAPQEEKTETEIQVPGEAQQAAGVIRRGRQTRVPATETNLAELTYSELDLMPMRCYGCGEVIRQIAIEDSLRAGRSLKETLDQLDYPLLCCRDLIRSQVSVLEIEKRRAAEARIRATPLNLAATAQPSTFSLGPQGSVSRLRVVDEAPPGTTEAGISFPEPIEGGSGPIIGSEESFLLEGASPGDAYQYFMMQAQGDLERGGDDDE
uniref:Uncharacterized protein n=1 Tax=viral metagenome TaxID=1070528 RepID=A0A6C0IYU0_9ZZZZ